MTEQDTSPHKEEAEERVEEERPKASSGKKSSSGWLLPAGLVVIALVLLYGWRESRPPLATSLQPSSQSTSTLTPTRANTRVVQIVATATQTATLPPQQEQPTNTSTAEPVTGASEIALPTVTPTLVPSAIATRTIEIRGRATLRIQLANESFQSSGQPVDMAVEPRTYLLGGDISTVSDQWCMQLGSTGLVFDMDFSILPVSEDLQVNGNLQLFDGFCGSLGSLGDLLASSPLEVTIPAGSAAQVFPSLQAEANLLGLDKLLNVNTGVFLDLTIRNPQPR
jgi:hypothetical protein